jgi:aryl-alcohol dehydrogenase-like predicted oxidoreductase
MEVRELGRTGLAVPRLGFGCGAVGGLMVRGDAAEQARAVGRALDAGVRYFDTAPSYGDGRSEENLGRALAALDGGRDVLVGTKVRLSSADLERPADVVRRSLEDSLRRLGRDRVDLFQLHNRLDGEDFPVRDVAEAMRRTVDDGLAGHVGFTGLGTTTTLHRTISEGLFETVQAYVNALNPSGVHPGATSGEQDFQGLVTRAAEHGVGVIDIRVYAAGALTAATARHPIAGQVGGQPLAGAAYGDDVSRAAALALLAAEADQESGLELGLRFALGLPGISVVLVGLSSFEHLDAALRWEARGPLPPDVSARVVELARGAG